MNHDVVDWVLGIGSMAATVASGVVAVFVVRYFSRRDGLEQEVAKQGDRINRHAVEIRHTQREAKISPFYSGDDI